MEGIGPIINAFLEEGSDAAAFATGNDYLTFIAFFFVCIVATLIILPSMAKS